MQKQIKWPKWTEEYEDVKENNKIVRIVTRAERAWDRIDNHWAVLISAARHIYRTLRPIKGVQK